MRSAKAGFAWRTGRSRCRCICQPSLNNGSVSISDARTACGRRPVAARLSQHMTDPGRQLSRRLTERLLGGFADDAFGRKKATAILMPLFGNGMIVCASAPLRDSRISPSSRQLAISVRGGPYHSPGTAPESLPYPISKARPRSPSSSAQPPSRSSSRSSRRTPFSNVRTRTARRPSIRTGPTISSRSAETQFDRTRFPVGPPTAGWISTP